MRERFCRICKGWHDVSKWPRACVEHYGQRGPRSDLPSPRFIRDQMDALWHPSTGEYTDSKSHFREMTRASGGEEVGNDTQADNRKYDECTADDIGQAINMVSQGYNPQIHGTANEGWE